VRVEVLVACATCALALGCTGSGAVTPPDGLTTRKIEGADAGAEATVARARVGDVRLIHRVEWPDAWGQFLVGVEPKARRAHLRLTVAGETPRFALDTIDLSTGERVARWEATPARAARMVGRYPRFEGVSGEFVEDLGRYARMLRASGPWRHRETAPPLAVSASPDGARAIYAVPPDDGRDGDWLMLVELATGAQRRFDEGIRASYVAKFSPDSRAVAWIGGSAEFARPGRQVGYVLRVASLDGTPRAVPEVRGVIRAPLWSPDGRTIWAMGHGRDRRERCLYRVSVPSFDVARLECHVGDVDVVMSEDASRMMLLQHAPQGRAQRLVWLDPRTDDVLARHEVSGVHGVGEFGRVLGEDRALLYVDGGQALVIYEPMTGAEVQRVDLGEDPVAGRHATQLAGDELILLRRRDGAVEVVGVTVR
jgi:hypothetical protein